MQAISSEEKQPELATLRTIHASTCDSYSFKKKHKTVIMVAKNMESLASSSAKNGLYVVKSLENAQLQAVQEVPLHPYFDFVIQMLKTLIDA